MSRMDQLSSHKTAIYKNPRGIAIVYHETAIVEFNDNRIKLNSGGWRTVTTKRKMNQTANQFGLGYEVKQKGGNWFVTLPTGETVPFHDGISFGHKSIN